MNGYDASYLMAMISFCRSNLMTHDTRVYRLSDKMADLYRVLDWLGLCESLKDFELFSCHLMGGLLSASRSATRCRMFFFMGPEWKRSSTFVASLITFFSVAIDKRFAHPESSLSTPDDASVKATKCKVQIFLTVVGRVAAAILASIFMPLRLARRSADGMPMPAKTALRACADRLGMQRAGQTNRPPPDKHFTDNAHARIAIGVHIQIIAFERRCQHQTQFGNQNDIPLFFSSRFRVVCPC